MKHAPEQAEVTVATPMPLVDQLKAKRAQISRESSARVRRLDRQINLLESSDAETIVQDAQRALYED